MINEINNTIRDFCLENGIDVTLRCDMPAGYETAFGTYDVTVNTLFLNTAVLQDAPRHEVLFYLFHELRHAVQYLCPMRFDAQIRESLPYVILYNGSCFKLVANQWQACTLDGEEDYFTRAYMSMPYEIDANTFAYQKAKEACGDTPELQALLDFWVPGERLDEKECQRLFRRIDAALQNECNGKSGG